MTNVTFITVPSVGGQEIEHAVIDNGDGNFTSMPKSVYDEMIAKNEAASL